MAEIVEFSIFFSLHVFISSNTCIYETKVSIIASLVLGKGGRKGEGERGGGQLFSCPSKPKAFSLRPYCIPQGMGSF